MEDYTKDNLKNSDYVLRDNGNKIHNNEFLFVLMHSQRTHNLPIPIHMQSKDKNQLIYFPFHTQLWSSNVLSPPNQY